MAWKQAAKFLPLLIYALMAGALAMTVLVSAAAYSNSAELAARGAGIRVAGQFVRMKARQGGASVSVNNGRMSALHEYPEGVFEETLYCSDGALMEILAYPGMAADGSLDGAGDVLLRCGGLAASENGGLLEYAVDGRSGSVLLPGGR